MKKKTYKHMINRILRLEKAIRYEASRRKEMEEAAKYYKDRLQSIGKNMKTEDVNSEGIRTIKWEIHPLTGFGTFAAKLNVIPREQMPHKGKIELIETEMKK